MTSEARLERVKRNEGMLEAALRHVHHRTVPLLIFEAAGAIPVDGGSSVPVWIGDSVWLLTARHVVDELSDRRQLRIPLGRAGRFVPDIVKVWRHPDEEIDIAAILLGERAKSQLLADQYIPVNLEKSIEFSQKKEYVASRLEDASGMLVVGGYPKDLITTQPGVLRVDFVGANTTFAGFARATPFPVRDIDPELGMIPFWIPMNEAKLLGDWSNAPTLTPSWKGLSGCGLWWIEEREDGDVSSKLVSIYQGRYAMEPIDGEFFGVTYAVSKFAPLLQPLRL